MKERTPEIIRSFSIACNEPSKVLNFSIVKGTTGVLNLWVLDRGNPNLRSVSQRRWLGQFHKEETAIKEANRYAEILFDLEQQKEKK